MTNTATSNLADEIVDIVKRYTGTSYAELEREIAALGVETKGEYATHTGNNCVLWVGMSEEVEAAIRECRDSDRIHCHPLLNDFEIFVVYANGGKMPLLPIAHRPPKNGYKEPHWIPVVWYLGSHCLAKNCPGEKL